MLRIGARVKSRAGETPPRTMQILDSRLRESGGLEGLPLQLMIVILVATMGTAIIMGWMGSIDTPHSIGSVQYDDTMENDDGSLADFSVTVTDQDGNLLEGATVILSGLNVRNSDGGTAYAITDKDGIASFEGLTINPAGTSGVGFIDLLVTKSGYTDSSTYKITVIL